MRNTTMLLTAGATLLIAGAVVAQDYSQSPAYGTQTLTAGFTPDPTTVSLTAGGTIDVSSRNLSTRDGSHCAGNIANAPDVRLNYTSGSWPLIFKVASSADTTLVVNGPDGAWYCNDDFDGLNPRVSFSSPSSGQYDIWVGTYGDSLSPAELQITELTN